LRAFLARIEVCAQRQRGDRRGTNCFCFEGVDALSTGQVGWVAGVLLGSMILGSTIDSAQGTCLLFVVFSFEALDATLVLFDQPSDPVSARLRLIGVEAVRVCR